MGTEDNDSVIMAASFGRVCSRGLSSSASLSQLAKTPTPVYGTEGRYAAALYSAASKNKALEAVEKDLKTMTATLGKDAQFAAFLADPSVKKNMKADGVAGACDKLKMNVLSKNLFVAMAENGRHGLVGPVISSFNTIMAAHRGEVICTVSTAKALAAPMKKEVEATIPLFLKKGEKSLISYEVKPEIMGGMRSRRPSPSSSRRERRASSHTRSSQRSWEEWSSQSAIGLSTCRRRPR